MKGDYINYKPEVIKDDGISPKVTRITEMKYSSHHLYFPNPSFTRDDSKIVFQANNEGGYDLYCLDLKQNRIRQLTEGRNLDHFPFISWDGKKVYFGDGPSIWVLDLESLEEKQLLHAPDLVGKPVKKASGTFPSYDGKRLVCFYEAEADYGLIMIQLDTGESKIIVRGEQPVRHCQFCPMDNDLLVYAHEGKWHTIQNRMWLVNYDGSNNRPVRKQVEGEQVGHEFWANKSKKVFFTLYREDGNYIKNYDVDKNEEETIIKIDNCHSMIDPNDRFVAADNNHGKADELFLVDIETRKAHVLCYPKMSWAKGTARFHPHPSFSSKGDKVIYTSDAGGSAAVYVAEIPDSLLHR